MDAIQTVLTGITGAQKWLFSLFQAFITMIQSNPVLFYLVAFSIVAGSIGLVLALIKRFGLKGRRR